MMRRLRSIVIATVVGGAVFAGSAGSAPQKVPGCPAGYEKGSTIDFPQFAYADRNGNTLVCFKETSPGSGEWVVRDDHPYR
jgi:hypothetical protein